MSSGGPLEVSRLGVGQHWLRAYESNETIVPKAFQTLNWALPVIVIVIIGIISKCCHFC